MIYKVNKVPGKAFLTALFLLVTFIVSACGDPVIYYHPKDWEREDNTWFTKSYENFDIKITDIGGITINDHLIPEAIIYNRSKSPLTLERVILNSGGTEYTAHPFSEKSWETIPPNPSRRLGFDSFDRCPFSLRRNFNLRPLSRRTNPADRHFAKRFANLANRAFSERFLPSFKSQTTETV